MRKLHILPIVVISLTFLTTLAGTTKAQIRDLPLLLTPAEELAADSALMATDTIVPYDTVMVYAPMSDLIWLKPVYTNYQMPDTVGLFAPELSGEPWMEWIERAASVDKRSGEMLQNFMIRHPDMVKENIAFMELPPRKFYGTVNPADHTIEVKEVELEAPEKIEVEVHKKHWLRKFEASLQFSQAYVSPNWYQGGNNNLNAIANIYYNVKLNQAYHPNLLFETTMQYKLGINSAPDDSLRTYSTSEDLLQINSTFGLKAAKHWYYSLTGQFKTQLINAYESNTRNMTSAFMSPAELNLGLGMTYNYASANGRVTFDVTISPLAYDLKICTKPNDVINHAAFGIDADKHTKSEVGSSVEAKLAWQICDNIALRSRFFIFTDYHGAQADWENTIAFNINKYLTTQLYVHARFDTDTPKIENSNWRKVQLKEILSFGVAYKFSSL